MKKNKELSTDELFQKAAAGQALEPELFIDPDEEKLKLRQDIERQFTSVSQFSEACYVSRSQITDFFNNTKKISRDRMIAMFIVLGYDVSTIRSLLERFQLETLYIKNRRDHAIVQALRSADQQKLRQQHRLDHVESNLIESGEQPLINA